MKNRITFLLGIMFISFNFLFAQNAGLEKVAKLLYDYNHAPAYMPPSLREDLMLHPGKIGTAISWQTVKSSGFLYPFFGKSILKQNGTEYIYKDGWHLVGNIEQDVEADSVILGLDRFEILLIICLIGALIYSPLISYQDYRRIIKTDFQNIDMKRRMLNFGRYQKRLKSKFSHRNDFWIAFLLFTFSFYLLLMSTGTLPNFVLIITGTTAMSVFSALGVMFGNIWIKKIIGINEGANMVFGK